MFVNEDACLVVMARGQMSSY